MFVREGPQCIMGYFLLFVPKERMGKQRRVEQRTEPSGRYQRQSQPRSKHTAGRNNTKTQTETKGGRTN